MSKPTSKLTEALAALADADAQLRHILAEKLTDITDCLIHAGNGELDDLADELHEQLAICRRRSAAVHHEARAHGLSMTKEELGL